jgi:hypothetical protein
MKNLPVLGLGIFLSIGFAGLGSSQPILRDDPKRPVTEISKDLGIQPEQFRACFSNVSPSPEGQRPETQRTQANKAVLLSCLQKANSKITNDSLDTVMDRYRPGGREAQLPPGR